MERLARHVDHRVAAALEDTRVVVIQGARQVGKSTIARTVAERTGAAFLSLDEPSTLAAARADPVSLVSRDRPVVIDEIQRVPELLLAIKQLVDADPQPGRFLLTGSARLAALRQVPDTLPGRSETITLAPLSQGELESRPPERFVDMAFDDVAALGQADDPACTRASVAERVARGGFPEAVARSDPARRARFHESYIADIVAREVRALSRANVLVDLPRLMRLLAARTAQPLVVDSLARDAGASPRSIGRAVDAIDLAFLIERIPAWSTSQTARATSHPKVVVTDSGVAAHLLGQDASALADRTELAGPLLEGFALMEIARQLTWSATRARLYHYRTRDGVEVDGVLERADGRICGLEIKAAASVSRSDFRGLDHLKGRVGARMGAAIVLYAGPRALGFGEGRWAIPISAIWRAGQPAA